MNAYLETRSYSSKLPIAAFPKQDDNYLAHWHIEVEMAFVCEGSIRIGINNESKILHKGELAICSSTDIHFYDSTGLNSTILVVVFRPEIIGSPGGWPENLLFVSPFISKEQFEILSDQTQKEIPEIFYSIVNEIKAKKPFYELYVKGKISELCALIIRHFPTISVKSVKRNFKPPDIQKIQYAIHYIENNFMTEMSLDDISKKTNLSSSYFSRLFRQFTGMNFKSYLDRVRVNNAEDLLKANEKSIIDISFACGFSSLRTFNRIFKSVKGYTPSKTRSI